MIERWTSSALFVHEATVLDRHAIAAALAAQCRRDGSRPTVELASTGWRSMADSIDVTALEGPAERTVTLRMARSGRRTVTVDGDRLYHENAHDDVV